MAKKSEQLGLCSWNFWNFLFSMRLLKGEYLRDFKIFDLTWIWWIWLELPSGCFFFFFFFFFFKKFFFFFFFFFQKFDVLGSWWGKRAKNVPKWQKHSVPLQELRNHTSYDCHLWYTFGKWKYLQVFFHFFKILIFWVVMAKG